MSVHVAIFTTALLAPQHRCVVGVLSTSLNHNASYTRWSRADA